MNFSVQLYAFEPMARPHFQPFSSSSLLTCNELVILMETKANIREEESIEKNVVDRSVCGAHIG